MNEFITPQEHKEEIGRVIARVQAKKLRERFEKAWEAEYGYSGAGLERARDTYKNVEASIAWAFYQAADRERKEMCAVICDEASLSNIPGVYDSGALACAKAIREAE